MSNLLREGYSVGLGWGLGICIIKVEDCDSVLVVQRPFFKKPRSPEGAVSFILFALVFVCFKGKGLFCVNLSGLELAV